jgi:Family of unknown function (DUF6188)
MYGLPKSIDLTFLNNLELFNVCIGFNDLILQFDEGVTLSITSECSYQTSERAIIKIDHFPEEANIICKLLGNKIIAAKGYESGTLELRFSNGDTFILYDDSKQYESYLIRRPGMPDIIV